VALGECGTRREEAADELRWAREKRLGKKKKEKKGGKERTKEIIKKRRRKKCSGLRDAEDIMPIARKRDKPSCAAIRFLVADAFRPVPRGGSGAGK
jgi:hypothetical protein